MRVVMSANQIQNLANAIKKMPSKRYLSYIVSPQWKQIRDEHLRRNDHLCEICRKARACQVHHWTYTRLGYEHPIDLCAVCVTCHHRIHCSILPTANDNQLLLPLKYG